MVKAAFVALLLGNTAAFGPHPGCMAVSDFPCLPGIDAVGIGYDAVKGTSFGVGRPVVSFNYSKAGHTYTDPFGNRTTYSYADQVTVRASTTGDASHSVFRSVQEYVTQQQNSVNIHGHYGAFFKASTSTTWAKSKMSDSLSIIAISESQLGLYTITVDTPVALQFDEQFLQNVANLPDDYDEEEYQQFMQNYGTHYISAATLGGKATMKTTIAHDYFSTHTDTNIQANVEVSFHGFGGGGGGGHSANQTSQDWKSNSQFERKLIGGDPSIGTFNSDADWIAWAKSVETSAPAVIAVSLVPLWTIPALQGPKRANLITAVQTYASNETFPQANLTNVQMSWCECYSENLQTTECDKNPRWKCQSLGCQKSGYVATNFVLNAFENGETEWMFDQGASDHTMTCCRPCFTAQN